MSSKALPSNAVWGLYRTNDVGDWVLVSAYGTLSEAVRHVVKLDGVLAKGIFLELHVSTEPMPDDEVLGHFEYRGWHPSDGSSSYPLVEEQWKSDRNVRLVVPRQSHRRFQGQGALFGTRRNRALHISAKQRTSPTATQPVIL